MAPSLYTELDNLLVDCHIDEDGPESSFLPINDLNEKITRDSIKIQLPKELRQTSLPDKILLRAKKVFAILVLIEEPLAIYDLVEKDKITDGDLPLYPKGPKDFSIILSADGSKSFNSFASWTRKSSVKHFFETQSFMLAPILEYEGQHLELDSKCPLPVYGCVRKSSGGSGVVYQGRLHAAHQKIFKSGEEPYIAIKEVLKKEAFEKELRNLEKVQRLQNKHLIKLLATVTMGKRSPFYFIFPWADGGDLKDFWKRESSRPRDPELILWCLQQELGIVSGLKALHAENGRHGDLKPQNILHFKAKDGGLGTLVIADVGVSRFHQDNTGLRHSPTAAKEYTVSYEAPEAEPDRLQGKPRPRRYDMWSIGCMFLESAIWLLYGYNAFRRFRQKRSDKNDPKTAGSTFFTHNQKGGAEIHAAVADAIRILLEDPRCDGTALKDLILLTKDHLLQIDVQDRAEASLLYDKFEKIVRKAEQNPSYLCKELASIPPTPHFFRSRKDSNSSTSSSGSSTR